MTRSKVREWHFKQVESSGLELIGGSVMDVRRKRFYVADVESPLVKADLIDAFEKKQMPEVEYDRRFIGQNRFLIKIKKVIKD
ncbi:hypothetical protein HY639_01255 [Candidatus Woesearchaeota archaeon]|nr:hypothetical protein [Candidatus Woesearchaeota archaeon]